MRPALHMADLAEERREREDRVPVGDTRPARFLGLPYALALALGAVAYLLALNIGGWRGGAVVHGSRRSSCGDRL